MPYHQGLTRAQGDPGFFGFLGKAIGTVARAVPGPIGTIAKAVGLPTFGGTTAPRAPAPTPMITGPTLTQMQATPQQMAALGVCPRKKRRRMNPLNPKALARANRRQKAFLRQVDRTLASMPTKGQVARRRRQIAGAKK